MVICCCGFGGGFCGFDGLVFADWLMVLRVVLVTCLGRCRGLSVGVLAG